MKLKLVDPQIINARNNDSLVGHLGIKITAITEEYVEGTMPVDQRTHQPYGILHGGASVVLAETLGSIASNINIDMDKFYSVGLDINANHISAVRNGHVIGRAKPLHMGRSTHVWEIRITTPQDKLVCISRLTMAIVPKKIDI
jgi:1,4-dihydroxy-2-naphthoyl-CoA hydrolase